MIICREEMVLAVDGYLSKRLHQARKPQAPAARFGWTLNTTPKKLLCGHGLPFLLFAFLAERQQSCPTWLVLTPISITIYSTHQLTKCL